MLVVVDAARLLGDRAAAAAAADLLRPYAALPVMPSLAVSCLGAVSYVLGVAAVVTGDLDAAVTYLQDAHPRQWRVTTGASPAGRASG